MTDQNPQPTDGFKTVALGACERSGMPPEAVAKVEAVLDRAESMGLKTNRIQIKPIVTVEDLTLGELRAMAQIVYTLADKARPMRDPGFLGRLLFRKHDETQARYATIVEKANA